MHHSSSLNYLEIVLLGQRVLAQPEKGVGYIDVW